MKDVFDIAVSKELIARINQLNKDTKPLWGKMTAAQMLAHCSVTYEMVYTKKHKRPNFLTRIVLNMFVKPMVVGTKPYPKNGKTAPHFLITDTRDFEQEKKYLIDFIEQTQGLGEGYFKNKVSLSFGRLSISEWNTMFYKHLHHHLTQFGV